MGVTRLPPPLRKIFVQSKKRHKLYYYRCGCFEVSEPYHVSQQRIVSAKSIKVQQSKDVITPKINSSLLLSSLDSWLRGGARGRWNICPVNKDDSLLNRYLISTLQFWIWVLDFSHFETSFGLLNIFLDFYLWLTGRWDICWDDSHILSHVFVKSILGSVTFEREPVWLIGYSKKKMMTHNFVACLCQKQIGNSHLNILGQWRWFVRFFICECLFTSYAQ